MKPRSNMAVAYTGNCARWYRQKMQASRNRSDDLHRETVVTESDWQRLVDPPLH